MIESRLSDLLQQKRKEKNLTKNKWQKLWVLRLCIMQDFKITNFCQQEET